METQKNQETKLCKYCQTEIPKKAKICPNCRKKQGSIIKWIGIAAVVILIIGLLPGGEDSDNQTKQANNNFTDNSSQQNVQKQNIAMEESTDQDEAEAPDDKDNIIEVGSSFEKNGLKITINEADTDFQNYENEYGWNTPEEGMKYIMASFTFENNGDSDSYVSIYDFKCYADNTTCEQVYGLDDSGFINTNLSSGRNVSFKTYYSVPIDSSSIELEYETNVWTGEKAVIKIQ